MKKSISTMEQITFKQLEEEANVITVFRMLSKNQKEPIGKIYPDSNSTEDSFVFKTMDNYGEELFPPTTDFIEIEQQFEKYAEEISKETLINEYRESDKNPLNRKKSLE